MSAPDITIRQTYSPYDEVTSISYIQSKIGSGALPVLHGEVSNPVLFRVYNNFALAAGIISAINVQITVYDGVGAGSHTALNSPASNSWLNLFESGYGAPGEFTDFPGTDTSIGGANTYIPEIGDNGTFGTPTIRGNAGFMQFESYLNPQSDAVGDIYNFAITVLYEYA